MIGALLKIPLKLVKLQIKLTLLPAKAALRLARKCAGASDTNDTRQSATASSTQTAPAAPSTNELEVDASELMKVLEAGEEVVLIDVRQAQELANGGLIAGSVHIPSQDLPHRIEDLDKDRATIVYCHLGSRSMDAAMFLREKGFLDVRSLGGGIVGWESDGGSIVSL